MNDELRQLERRLEQATARRLPDGTTLDSETAALREGWLAMAQLLEAADAASAEMAPVRPLPPAGSRRTWMAAAAAAIAASLLVGGALAWKLSSGGNSVEQVAKDRAPSQQPEPLRAPEKDLTAFPMALPDTSSDESLDEGIARAYQELIRIEQDWHRLGSASAPLANKLEQIGQELSQSTI